MNIYRQIIKGLDFIFEVLIILLIAFVWSRYFIDSTLWAILVTITLTTILAFLLAKRKQKKDTLAMSLNLNNKRKDDFKNYFLYEPSKTILEFIKEKVGGEIAESDNNLIINKDTIYIMIRKIKDVSKDDVLPYLQNLDFKYINKVTLLCISIEPDCKNFLTNISNVHFEVETIDEIANKYYSEQFKDESFDNKGKIKFKQNAIITFKMFLLMLIRPQNTKGYFFSAIAIIFASIVVPQKLYYYIFASVLLILALSSKLIKNK